MSNKKGSKVIQSEDPFALCIVAIAPMRARPSHSEEQVSQLLFGEQMEILDRKGKHWLKIRCDWDRYAGWVETEQVHRISEKDFIRNRERPASALDLVQGAKGTDISIPICIGSTLTRFDGMTFQMPMGKMTYSGQALFADSLEISQEHLVKLGMKYIHSPYQWGGRSPFGIDSSGLMQMIFKLGGMSIPRDANRQIEWGTVVDFPSNAILGDLAFFENSKGNIVHVGMIAEESKILHSYGRVRLDHFDHHGIYNSELGKYTHRLRIIKRLEVGSPYESELSREGASA